MPGADRDLGEGGVAEGRGREGEGLGVATAPYKFYSPGRRGKLPPAKAGPRLMMYSRLGAAGKIVGGNE